MNSPPHVGNGYMLDARQLNAEMERVIRACTHEITAWDIKRTTGLHLTAVRRALARATAAGRLKFRTRWGRSDRPVDLYSIAE